MMGRKFRISTKAPRVEHLCIEKASDFEETLR